MRSVASGCDVRTKCRAVKPLGLFMARVFAGERAFLTQSSDRSRCGAYFDPNIAHVVLRALGSPKASSPPENAPLTPRELEIVRSIADGTGNQEIAGRLHLGLGTVKGHICDILEKTPANDRIQAAVLALRRGLI
jgi:DNA-binding NarL/FixJ family response regulator